MHNSRISLIVILALIALVLIFAIYTKTQPQQQSAGNQTSSPRPTLLPAQPPPWFTTLSESDRALFNNPSQDASPSAKRNFVDQLKVNAQKATEVSIGKDCKPSAIVLLTDQTLTFKIKNADTVSHKIQAGPDNQFDIEAGGTSTAKLSEKGTVVNLGCDTYSRVGFIITPL